MEATAVDDWTVLVIESKLLTLSEPGGSQIIVTEITVAIRRFVEDLGLTVWRVGQKSMFAGGNPNWSALSSLWREMLRASQMALMMKKPKRAEPFDQPDTIDSGYTEAGISFGV